MSDRNRYDRGLGEGRVLTILYPPDMTVKECNQLHEFVELIKKISTPTPPVTESI